jgi:hypothetical protein
MVTLTIKNQPHLVERLEHLAGARKLLSMRLDNYRKRGGWGTSVVGGFRSVEVKRGSGGHGWHPHSHELWFVERGTDLARLEAELGRAWKEITVDSHRVDVQAPRLAGELGLDIAVCEVVKYNLKYLDQPVEDTVEVLLKAKGQRFFSTFGVCYRMERAKSKLPEVLVPVREFSWNVESKRYDVANCNNSETLEEILRRASRARRKKVRPVHGQHDPGADGLVQSAGQELGSSVGVDYGACVGSVSGQDPRGSRAAREEERPTSDE